MQIKETSAKISSLSTIEKKRSKGKSKTAITGQWRLASVTYIHAKHLVGNEIQEEMKIKHLKTHTDR